MFKDPDVWVIVKFHDQKMCKLLCGWYGGYTTSEKWKLSSKINHIVDKDSHYEFHNESGSIYRCHKNAETVSSYTASVYDSMREIVPNLEIVGVEHICT